MTEKVKKFLAFYKNGDYRKRRKTVEYGKINENEYMINPVAFKIFCNNEEPIIYENDIFGFNRTVKNIPRAFQGGNLTPGYYFALDNGLGGMIDRIKELKKANPNGREFYEGAEYALKTLFDFAIKYKEKAEKTGNKVLSDGLRSITTGAPKNYYEALLTLKAVIFALRGSAVNHVTLGRFDKYMYPFYIKSIESGCTEKQILELTELFFISLNIDADVYFGIQQGDNGQSIVLGGKTEDSDDVFNGLSEIVIKASEELCLIDPKINIRVSSRTPIERFILGTKLTAKGLGFPQYSNDDIVIDGLTALGYERADATDYSIAACWEFNVPDVDCSIVNIGTLAFPEAIRQATVNDLDKCEDFTEFFACAKNRVKEQFISIASKIPSVNYEKGEKSGSINPILSIFFKPCRESGKDINQGGGKYNNFGIHGLGIAPAVDALAAIKLRIFEEKSISVKELSDALTNNFAGYEKLRNMLLQSPKLGNDEDYTNEIAMELLDYYSKTVNGTPNGRGGVWRAGSGGPHDYVYVAEKVKATADGRLSGEPFPSSFSPSIGVKTNGLLSVINSFTCFDMKKIINGGPLTVEIHENVFTHTDGIEKVALLVRSFIKKGGHQLQLNAIAREKLLDAQKHPEKYPDLIVRVWGWSGYFNELDLRFQNQIIKRMEYGE